MFKPQENKSQGEGSSIDWNAINEAVKAGSRPARVSLIVDLGTQEREDFTETFNPAKKAHTEAIENGLAVVKEVEGEEMFVKPQKPVQQLALFCDLVNDVVNYGETLGDKPYRIMMNNSFMSEIKGVTFGAVRPTTQGGLWTFHGNSLLTKLANATGNTQIISDGPDNMDVSQLLGGAFMATIVKKTSTDGTKTYINFKGATPAPEMPDGSPYPIPELDIEPLCITFDSVTEDSAKFLNKNVKDTIRNALNFKGSKMEAILGDGEAAQTPPPPPKQEAPKVEEPSTPDAFDDDIPF